jgi:hypothetical protein
MRNSEANYSSERFPNKSRSLYSQSIAQQNNSFGSSKVKEVKNNSQTDLMSSIEKLKMKNQKLKEQFNQMIKL